MCIRTGQNNERPSASLCQRLCPRCFLSVKTGSSSASAAAPSGRPLPPIPLPHVEAGRIELPPSILNASDRIIVENV